MRITCLTSVASVFLMLAAPLCSAAPTILNMPTCQATAAPAASLQAAKNLPVSHLLVVPNAVSAPLPNVPAQASAAPNTPPAPPPLTPVTPGQLIVIGFMGGNVNANNLAHREALVARDLQQLNPHDMYSMVFANGDSKSALSEILMLLDHNRNGCLTLREKNAARIVIFGHSWGASEAITLARRLNDFNIPVLLTIQVDSVQKLNENDGSIPPNVHEAINFYQTEGLLHGRSLITASDPARTTILGNFQSSYKSNPISVSGFPWYARAFMHTHIEIENDPVLWTRIQALIQTKATPTALALSTQAAR